MIFQHLLFGQHGLTALQARHHRIAQRALHAQCLRGHGADRLAQYPLRHIAAHARQWVDHAHRQSCRAQIHLGLHHHIQIQSLARQGDFSVYFGVGHGTGNGQVVGAGNAPLHVQAAIDAIEGKTFLRHIAQARQALQAQQADEFERPGINAGDVPFAQIQPQLARERFQLKGNG